jgi:hypothetical protein
MRRIAGRNYLAPGEATVVITNNKPTEETAALAAVAPFVALATVLQNKGILSMVDLYEELAILELSAAASNTASAQRLSEAAGAAKDLLLCAGLYAHIAPPSYGTYESQVDR